MKTFGFDYVFALSVVRVNEILRARLATADVTLALSSFDKESGSTITLSARLGPWQIARGGSNTLLNVNVPIVSGTLKVEGGPVSRQYDLAGISAVMQIRLGWLSAGGRQDSVGAGAALHLIFSPDQTTNVENAGYVATAQIVDSGDRLGNLGAGILKNLMADAFVASRDRINVVLGVINTVPTRVHAWLTPVRWSYFYVEAGENSALAILCMVTDAALPQPAFDTTALAKDTNAVLLVSQQALFTNVVLPSLRKSYPEASLAISCVNDDCTISNSAPFTVMNTTATVFTLTPTPDGHGILTHAAGGGPLRFLFGLADLPDASYEWSVDATHPHRFSEQRVVFERDPAPRIHESHVIQWYDWLLLAAVGVASLPGLISMIVDAARNFSEQVDANSLAGINEALEQAVGGAVVNLTELFDWKGGGHRFDAVAAGLEGAFFVRANLS